MVQRRAAAKAAPRSRQDDAHDRYLRRSEIDRPRRRSGRSRQAARAPMPPMRSPCAAARPACRCGSARSRRTEASESDDVSLRVFVGQRVASVSATAASDPKALAERAVAMARVSPEDPYQGLADPALLAKSHRDLDLFDATEVSADQLKEARACRRRGGTCRQGRHQFGRQRRQRRAGRAGAGHVARLPRPLCRLALFALGQRDRRRGHRHGARLRLFLAPAFRRPRRAARRSAARPANARCAASTRARPRPDRSTWCSIRASRAASPAILPAPSTARRSRARPASCAT